jgi:phage pi2 protein 07
MKAAFRRYGDCLDPGNEKAKKLVNSVEPGGWVTVEVKKVRSMRQLNLWWKLMQKVSDNTSYTKRQLHNNLLSHLGFCDEFTDKNGVVVRDPHSISAGEMPQDEFNELMDNAIDWIVENVLPVAKADLRREIEEMVF